MLAGATARCPRRVGESSATAPPPPHLLLLLGCPLAAETPPPGFVHRRVLCQRRPQRLTRCRSLARDALRGAAFPWHAAGVRARALLRRVPQLLLFVQVRHKHALASCPGPQPPLTAAASLGCALPRRLRSARCSRRPKLLLLLLLAVWLLLLLPA